MPAHFFRGSFFIYIFVALTSILVDLNCGNGVEAQKSPTISYIAKERVVNIGDTVNLQCSVQNATDHPVLWIKTNPNDPSNAIIISSGSSQLVPDSRFSIRYDIDSSTYTLQINKVQETDAGVYQCQVVMSSSNILTSDVSVYVRIPPVISENSTRVVTAISGSTVTLYCYATGYPRPEISWRRENNDLLPTGDAIYRGNVLTIYNLTKDDRGIYYCIANNTVGRGARRIIEVEVEFPPVITVDRPRYEQALQNNVDLICHVEAFPSPTIYWKKDDIQLNDNQNYEISVFATDKQITDSILRVINIEKQQYGNFTCVASNKLGTDSKDVELFETVNEVCPPAQTVVASSDLSSLLSIAKEIISKLTPTANQQETLAKDEIDMYFSSLAERFRRMPTEKQRKIRLQIENIFFDETAEE